MYTVKASEIQWLKDHCVYRNGYEGIYQHRNEDGSLVTIGFYSASGDETAGFEICGGTYKQRNAVTRKIEEVHIMPNEVVVNA